MKPLTFDKAAAMLLEWYEKQKVLSIVFSASLSNLSSLHCSSKIVDLGFEKLIFLCGKNGFAEFQYNNNDKFDGDEFSLRIAYKSLGESLVISEEFLSIEE